MNRDEHHSVGLEDEPFITGPGEEIMESADDWQNETDEHGNPVHMTLEEIVVSMKERFGKIEPSKVKYVKVGKGKNQAYIFRHAALANDLWKYLFDLQKKLKDLNDSEYEYFLDKCEEMGIGNIFKQRKANG